MQSLPDIAGAGATVAIATPNINARVFLLAVTGSGTVKVGGASASATNGIPLTSTDQPLVLPPLTADGGSTSPYSLGGTYAYIPIGATLSVAYEPFN